MVPCVEGNTGGNLDVGKLRRGAELLWGGFHIKAKHKRQPQRKKQEIKRIMEESSFEEIRKRSGRIG